jgi:DNA-binding MarR family transcriptional regulator
MDKFDPDRSIGRWISMAYRLLNRVLNRKFEALGFNSTQSFFIIMLFFNDGLSQETLSNSLQIDKANTARALSKLENMGLITREVAPHDRRAKLVHLTDKAREIQPAFFDIFTEMADMVASRFTPREQDMLLHMLVRLVDSLIEQTAKDEGKEKSAICEEICPANPVRIPEGHPWSSLGKSD